MEIKSTALVWIIRLPPICQTLIKPFRYGWITKSIGSMETIQKRIFYRIKTVTNVWLRHLWAAPRRHQCWKIRTSNLLTWYTEWQLRLLSQLDERLSEACHWFQLTNWVQYRYRILASNKDEECGNFMEESDPDVLGQTQSFRVVTFFLHVGMKVTTQS